MARIRSVHPGLFTDESFVSVSDAARVLLLVLGCFSDRDDRVQISLNHPAICGFRDVLAAVDELCRYGMFSGRINRGYIIGEINFLFGHARRPPRKWEKLRREVFKRDGYRCCYCGTSTEALHADHVIPVSRGGESVVNNLLTACRFCNLSKGNRLVPRARKS